MTEHTTDRELLEQLKDPALGDADKFERDYDRKLLELAAKAEGRSVIWKTGMHRGKPREGLFDRETGHVTEWDPLEDDGDALRLAVKLGIYINAHPDYKNADHVQVIYDGCRHVFGLAEHFSAHDGDRCAATRRAIVRAAAEIGSGAQ